MKKILITGGTGFIGRPLAVELSKHGHELTLISRNPKKVQEDWGLPSRFVKWDLENEACPISLEPFDVIVHLAGESLAGGRWTEERKKRIYQSRIESTRALGRALAARATALPLFISASAIGFYPFSDQQCLTEADQAGDHFLARLCRDWEAEVLACPQVSREVRLRFGIVLGDGGGVVQKLLTPTLWGGGAILASGEQAISWIHRDDVLAIIQQAFDDERFRGPINCVAPQPCPQELFQRTLGDLIHRPTFLRAPKALLRVVLGEMAEVLVESQKVLPGRLREMDYNYRFPDLQSALRDALSMHSYKDSEIACHRLSTAQFIPQPLPDVFAFFTKPENLERITPPLLNFHIKKSSSEAVAEGTRIEYRLKVRGVPLHWETLIRDWQTEKRFVDTQEKGPYSVWHHKHEFFPVPGGTLMTDEVKYRLPFGLLGDTLAAPLVKKDVQQIFNYRRKVIGEIFGRI